MTTKTTTPHPPGADLHLGGEAWAHPSLEPRLVPITDAIPYPGNPRRGDQDAITASIRDLGLYTGVVLQRSTGHILVGNHRRHALIALGAERIPVDYLDVDDIRAAAIVARDNLTSDKGGYDEPELLALLTADEDVLALSGYDDDDLAVLRASIDGDDRQGLGDTYTTKVDPVQYEPTMDEPPPARSLVDRTRTNDLLAAIHDTPDLPDDVRDFLVAGAQRHLVFDYAKVAEFYAHADPGVQALMEQSALVIIDVGDAIRYGYARLADDLEVLRGEAIAERAAFAAAGGDPDA